MDRKTWLVLGGFALLVVVAAGEQWFVLAHYDVRLNMPEGLWVNAAGGLAFVVAGLFARSSRPDSRMGRLMILFGFLWTARMLGIAPLVFWSLIPEMVAMGLLAIIFFAFPSGRLAGWERWAAGGFMVFLAGYAVLEVAFTQNPKPRNCCPDHLLLISDQPAFRENLGKVVLVVVSVVLAAEVALLVHRWRTSTRALRSRATTLGLVIGPLLLVLVALPVATAFIPGVPEPSLRTETYLQNIALVLLPIVILLELLRTHLSRARVGDLVRLLDDPESNGDLEGLIRDTLGDPEAQLLYRLESGDLVDGEGNRVEITAEADTTATGLAESAVLVHDPALDPNLVAAVGAAARLALHNARLQAELRAQIKEVQRSRQRIVAAADDARRRVERDLHDGAQQRLVALTLALREAHDLSDPDSDIGELLAVASIEADTAIDELRELAHGIHPTILNQAGLGPAVASLADRSPIPVVVDIPNERYPEDVEVAAYYVAAEALTNATKHADASEVVVRMEPSDGRLVLRVTDNGRGGVDRDGSGIAGLRDRIEAVNGHLAVQSRDGSGSELIASFPLDES